MRTAGTTVREISLSLGEPGAVAGTLHVPAAARGLIVFAHGSGSSRHSTRNQYVAGVLERAGFATLLMDLLTPSEERRDRVTAELRFDIGLLADRLAIATAAAARWPETAGLPIAYFGASTGAAAALLAAARTPNDVAAVVSRGGRPDLAAAVLPQVAAPTLLIVGGADVTVLEWNRRALALLRAPKQLAIVPGATHLFEEPGALEEAARLARDWFLDKIASSPPR